MAKTTFIDGVTAVTAAWLNEHFGSAGHVHDGVDDDGHAPKVKLKEHIDWSGLSGDANGYLEVFEDRVTEHTIRHVGISGAVATFFTDTLNASKFIGEVMQASLLSGLEKITFKDYLGDPAILSSRNTPKAMIRFTPAVSGTQVDPVGTPFNATVAVSGGGGNGLYLVTLPDAAPSASSIVVQATGMASSVIVSADPTSPSIIIVSTQNDDGTANTDTSVSLIVYWS